MKYQVASAASVLSILASLALPAIASSSDILTTSGPPSAWQTPGVQQTSDSNSSIPNLCISDQQVKQLQAETCTAKPAAAKVAPRAVDPSYPAYCPALPSGVTPDDLLYKEFLQRCLYGD